jgi:hypothetical protein
MEEPHHDMDVDVESKNGTSVVHRVQADRHLEDFFFLQNEEPANISNVNDSMQIEVCLLFEKSIIVLYHSLF